MLFETRRESLFECCPRCAGKLVRCLATGTAEVEQNGGPSHACQVWDRCEDCHAYFHWTSVVPAEAVEKLRQAFDRWGKQETNLTEFSAEIACVLQPFGGRWETSPTFSGCASQATHQDDQNSHRRSG